MARLMRQSAHNVSDACETGGDGEGGLAAVASGIDCGVRPSGWTGSGCGFDWVPSVVVLEL
jgi:hypothetical protein